MKKILYLILLLNTNLFAQNQSNLDSLLRLTKTNISNIKKVDIYLQIAEKYKNSNFINTKKYASKAIKLANKTKYTRAKIDASCKIAWTNMRFGNYDEAKVIYQREMKHANKLNYQRGKVDILNGLGMLHNYRGEYKRALKYLTETLKINKYLKDKKIIANSYNYLGVTYHYQNNYKKALEYYFKSLKIKKELGDKKGVAIRYNNIGVIYNTQGDYAKALKYYFKSLKIKEELGDKRGVAYSYHNIGLIYKHQKNYKKALNYYSKSLEINKKLEGKKEVIETYINIGNIYINENKNRKALSFFKKSLKTAKELGDKLLITIIYQSMGTAYENQSNFGKAKKYYLKSLEVAECIESKAQKSDALISIGNLYLKLNQWNLAQQYLSKGLQLATEKGIRENIRNATEHLALVEENLGNYKLAYEYHKLFKQTVDSLQNEELTQKITRMEAEYYFKQEKDSLQNINTMERIKFEQNIAYRKTIQIVTLIGLGLLAFFLLILFLFFQSKKRSNRLLKLKTKELEVANKEVSLQKEEILTQNHKLHELNNLKDRVFSIISHDLRSPINSLQGLLLIMKYNNRLSEQEMQKVITRLSESVEGVAGLLNNLLYWGKSQMEGELNLSPEPLVLQDYIQEVTQLFSEIIKTKEIKIIIDIERYIPNIYADPEILRFLLRNLLNNACKFSHPKGQVTIKVSQIKENLVNISIQDEGVGMNEKTKNSLFKGFVKSTKGTNAEKGTGLGLMLCQEFVELSQGKIGVESVLNEGSTFWFALPISSSG